MDAMVLGNTLKRTNTKHDIVLLATPDLLRLSAATSLSLFWDVREVRHVDVDPQATQGSNPRFDKVFTKLRAVELSEYCKVVLLDSDLLVRRNIDELFGLPAPAAVQRGRRDYQPALSRQAKSYFYPDGLAHGKLKGGINAGVVLLTPSISVFKQMETYLQTRACLHALRNSTQPEQDFLTIWFQHDWNDLHTKYNWQIQQPLFNPSEESDRMRLDFDDIAILHFSTEEKPSSFKLQTGVPRYDKWLDNLFNIKGGAAGRSNNDVRERLARATQEWFSAWNDTWDVAINEVPKMPNNIASDRCIFCGERGRVGVEHCFFTCVKILHLAHAWRVTCGGSLREARHRFRETPSGSTVKPALFHLGAIHRFFSVAPTASMTGGAFALGGQLQHSDSDSADERNIMKTRRVAAIGATRLVAGPDHSRALGEDQRAHRIKVIGCSRSPLSEQAP